MRRRLIGSSLAAGVTLSACGSGETPAPVTAPPAGSAPAGVSPSAPPATAPPAGTQLIASGTGRAVLAGDTLAVLTWTGGTSCHLVLRSPADPKTDRSRIDDVDGAALGCTLGAPAVAGTTLVLPYTRAEAGRGIEAGRTDRGITGLGPDGGPRWRTPLEVNTVVGASERFVLVTDARRSLPGSGEEHLTAVLDTATGRVLWQRPGLLARGIDDDTVVVTDPDITTVTALDAATGRQRWSSPMYPRGGLGLTGAGVTAVPVTDGSAAAITLRDTRTGAVLHREPGATSFPTCVSDGRTAVVCRTAGGLDARQILFAYDLTARKRTWDLPASRVVAAKIVPKSMVDGRVFFSTATGGYAV